METINLIERFIRSPLHGWNIGIQGAIGEFMYDAEESIDICVQNHGMNVISPRGALQIRITPATKCIAYEKPSPCTQSWSQTVDFCIPLKEANLTSRSVLTEIGVDYDAPLDTSKNEILFDLGLGSKQIQFCIRTKDEELLKILRQYCNRSVFENNNPVMATIQAASPNRVIISDLGRIEIYSSIQTSESGVPLGPHTHLLPKLLHAKKRPRPLSLEGYTTALTLSPVHPLFDKYGIPKTFDKAAYEEFQHLLTVYGLSPYCKEKERLNQIRMNGEDLKTYNSGKSSLQKLALNVLLAQLPYIRDLQQNFQENRV